MAIPRASAGLGRTILRRAATQSRMQAWRQTARRHASTGTASAERAKKTSDIPWIIGSVAFTVPAAVWLFNQGPQKSDHHGQAHEEESESKEEEAPAEESESKEEEAPAEESTEEKSEDDSQDKSEGKPEDEKKESEGDGDDKKSEDSSSEGSDGGNEKDTPDTSDDEDGYEKPGPDAPGQINYKSSMKKGPGEGQKGERKKSETKGEKDAASNSSGAQNPYLDDDEKSKKGEGLKETQKIHGTVDTSRPAR